MDMITYISCVASVYAIISVSFIFIVFGLAFLEGISYEKGLKQLIKESVKETIEINYNVIFSFSIGLIITSIMVWLFPSPDIYVFGCFIPAFVYALLIYYILEEEDKKTMETFISFYKEIYNPDTWKRWLK